MTETSNKSNIVLTDKKCLKINGAEGVVSLTDSEAGVVVAGEILVVRGTDIKAEKLSVETGELVLYGNFESLKFEHKKEKQGLIKRIFK